MQHNGESVLITDQEMKSKCRNKQHFYSNMQRNMFYLPSIKSSIVTLEYMLKVSRVAPVSISV